MAISDKTRKILWARSGNKCCLCNTDLVTSPKEPFATTVIGEECHIVSEATNGPRNSVILDFQYDVEDNLVLLCANCHKKIDSNVAYYTVEKIKEIKENHTEEVRAKLEQKEPENTFNKINGITVLPKIRTGKELLNLLDDCLASETDYEDTNDPDEINFIAATMENLTDYIDLLGMGYEIGNKISRIPELNKILEDIKQMNFGLFGEKKKRKHAID